MKNQFGLTTLQMVLAITLLFAIDSSGNASAEGVVSQADFKRACLAITANNPSYMVAVERVTSISMVKNWVATLAGERRMAVGRNVDKTEFFKGHCYWSISIYESNSTQLRLWKVFRVGVKSNDIYVTDDDGNYLPIAPQ